MVQLISFGKQVELHSESLEDMRLILDLDFLVLENLGLIIELTRKCGEECLPDDNECGGSC